MRIARVTIAVADPNAAVDFYAETLGLPVPGTTVLIGETELVLTRADADPGTHHLAFDVPSAAFEAARDWIASRVPLLRLGDQVEFTAPTGWNSRSVYFDGGSGEILEFIARDDLPPGTPGFSPADIQRISEVGVAVPDVTTARASVAAVGVGDYFGTAADFAPVGDIHGLLILVEPGRAWFPSADRRPGSGAITVEAITGHAGTIRLSPDAVLTTR